MTTKTGRAWLGEFAEKEESMQNFFIFQGYHLFFFLFTSVFLLDCQNPTMAEESLALASEASIILII